MAVGSGAPAAQYGSLQLTLEEQRWDVPLLASAWSLPAGEEEWRGHSKDKGFLGRAGAAVARWWSTLAAGATDMWAFVRADRRRPVFAAKVGVALALVSLLVFLREPQDIVSHSIWAILTVIFIFEFSIGATLSKCFNRGLGTLTAGGLALAVAELSKNFGEMEEVILIISIFIVGFSTNLAKLHPKMKPYEYGFRIFLVTFVIVMVAGYDTEKFTDKVLSRILLIALGTAICVGINIGIYPIWAGEDLHNSVAKNFAGVAKSLEGCVDGYLKCLEYQRTPSKIHTYQAFDDPLYSGYREVVETSIKEETLLGFAIWEPPHGHYKTMGYPWKSFTKVGGALRHCFFAVMALHGCVLSEIQAPPENRKVFMSHIHRVGREGAKVLCELGNNVKTMTKLSSSNILSEVHLAAEELQKKIDEKSYLLVNTERWDTSQRAEQINGAMSDINVHVKEIKNEATEPRIADQTSAKHYKSCPASSYHRSHESQLTIECHETLLSWPARRSFHPDLPLQDEESKTYESASALSLATFASLLIEFVARLQNVVNAFEELSDKANFKDHVEEPASVSKGNNRFLAKIWK